MAKPGRPKDEDLITPEDATMALLSSGGNQRVAYKLLRPDASNATANVNGSKLPAKASGSNAVAEAFHASRIDLIDKIKQIDQSIDVGWGVNATHKDSINSLKLLFDIYQMGHKNELEPLERVDYKFKQVEELGDDIKQLNRELSLYMRKDAIDQEL